MFQLRLIQNQLMIDIRYQCCIATLQHHYGNVVFLEQTLGKLVMVGKGSINNVIASWSITSVSIFGVSNQLIPRAGSNIAVFESNPQLLVVRLEAKAKA
jgi:hypothetical protein